MISFQLIPPEPDPDQLELNLGDVTGKDKFANEEIIWQPFDYQNDFGFLVANDNYGLNRLFDEFSPYVTEGVCLGMDENGDEYLGIGIICFDEVLDPELVWSIRKAKPESYDQYKDD